MGDSPGVHLPLNVPISMSLGDLGTNAYNLGTHSKFHQESPDVDPSRCSIMFSYAMIPISYITLNHPRASLHDLRKLGHLLSPSLVSNWL